MLANLYISNSLFHGRDLSPSTLRPRVIPHIPCFWCLPNTQTALRIKTYNPNVWTPADSPLLLGFLTQALNEVRQHLHTNSDGPIPNGQWLFRKYGFNWFAMNDSNHQITWGVMGAAVEALTNFMVFYGFSPTYFTIMDGLNIVGRGLLQPEP